MAYFVTSEHPILAMKIDLSSCRNTRRALEQAHRAVRAIPGKEVEVWFDRTEKGGWSIEVAVRKDSDLGWLERAIEAAPAGEKVGPYQSTVPR